MLAPRVGTELAKQVCTVEMKNREMWKCMCVSLSPPVDGCRNAASFTPFSVADTLPGSSYAGRNQTANLINAQEPAGDHPLICYSMLRRQKKKKDF